MVLEDASEHAGAIRAYLTAIAADPHLADAYYNLSRLYEQAGDRAAAIQHLRNYSELTKTH